nr:hypothetical protein [uncultured Devosia sp.]
MAAGLPLVIAAVLALFTVFALALAYAQWTTRGMDVYRGEP